MSKAVGSPSTGRTLLRSSRSRSATSGLALHQPPLDAIRPRRPRRGHGVPGEKVEQLIAPRSLVNEELRPPSVGLEAEPDPLRAIHPRLICVCRPRGAVCLRVRRFLSPGGAPAAAMRIMRHSEQDAPHRAWCPLPASLVPGARAIGSLSRTARECIHSEARYTIPTENCRTRRGCRL
jgi:hypothetical protein